MYKAMYGTGLGILLLSPTFLISHSIPSTAIAHSNHNFPEVLVAQNQPTDSRPKVKVLTTGGTIASRGATPLTLSDYTAGRVEGNALVEAVPEIQNFANVEVEEIANIGSPDMTGEIWLRMAKRINEIFETEPDVAGVVITHGTNTLEETSYFLHLTVKSDKPV